MRTALREVRAVRRLAMQIIVALVTIAAPCATNAQSAEPGTLNYRVAPHGNEARYLIREQLVNMNLPIDAIGKTSNVTGGIVIDASGAVVKSGSQFVIDMASLTSDSQRRDRYVRANTLGTATHPTAVFVPTELRGLRMPLPASGNLTFQMAGDLTVRGVTRPVVWNVTATVSNGSITGEAKTRLTFEQFAITKPRVGSVLSVDDDIRLEYTFFLVPAQ